jgi:polyhydroxyalkanoate synthase
MTTRKSSSKSSDGSQTEPKKTPTSKAAASKAKKPARKRAPKASAVKAKADVRTEAEAPQPPKQEQLDDHLGHMPQAYLEKLDEISRNVLKASLSGQKLLSERVRRSLEGDTSMMPQADPLHANPEVLNTWEHILSDPELLMQSQADLYAGYLDLWSNATRRIMSGELTEPVIEPDPSDKRWKSDAWREHPLFDAMKQSYLLNQRFLMGLVEGAKGVDEATKRKVQFLTQQLVDALAPTNFALTNPEVLEETVKSKGENLTRGLMRLVEDLERGEGRLALSQTDMTGFEVGKDLATTPGEVIYRNRVMELIQYAPATEQVRKRPLLIAPPWINKFYILDLRPKSSMIRWLTEQGFTVFLISWVNPDASMKDVTFEDYITEGLFQSLEVIEEVTGERQVDTVGYCIGGTMLGTALAWMAAKNDDRIASATFFAAQHDFKLAGDLLVFADEEWIAEISRLMDAQGGVLDGRTMADTFNMLRSNELVWSFVIKNYLLGREPQAFDLLYWNADQTRMPKTLHLFYLNAFYRQNLLAQGQLELDGHMLDMKDIQIPIFMQASQKDHIAPADSVYRSARLFGGPVEYMMAGSGHIAGVVNHPDAQKYQHWVNTHLPETREDWEKDAVEHPGSWWPHWRDWLMALSDEQVPARQPGGGVRASLCPAPGEYVKVRS